MAQSKFYCFTLNNYNEDYEIIFDPEYMKYMIYGREIGENGTKHLQGYVEFLCKQRLSGAKTKLGEETIHLEKRLGKQKDAINYCKKDGNYEEFGEPYINKQGQRVDLKRAYEMLVDNKSDLEISEECGYAWLRNKRHLVSMHNNMSTISNKEKFIEKYKNVSLYDWQKRLYDELETEPDERKVIWFIDRDGNWGKTFFSQYYFALKTGVQRFSNGKTMDINYQLNNPRVVFFDYTRSQQEYINYEVIESIKNGICMSTKYESCMKFNQKPHVVIFSNNEPNKEKMSLDRWDIRYLS